MGSYFKSRGWKDVIFLAVVIVLWLGARHFLFGPDDHSKWNARVQAEPEPASSQQPGQDGLAPCFFYAPPNSSSQKPASESVGDCLRLLPNGENVDIFEFVLGGGFFPIKTDLFVPDTIPLAFTRTYLPLTEWSDRFQVYLPNVYDLFLTGSRYPYTYVDWRLPDGQSLHYDRISSGTGFADAVYGSASGGREVAGSRINWNGLGWDWTLADGFTYISPEAYNATRPQQGSVVGIFDSKGNEVRLSRGSSGELTEIKSPHGRWIRLDYSQLHLIRARDSLGNAVEYSYDARDHLAEVKCSTGTTTKYSYDMADRIIRVEEPLQGIRLDIDYGLSGAVTAIRTGNQQTYQFRYVSDKTADTATAFIVEPGGKTLRVDTRQQNSAVFYTVR